MTQQKQLVECGQVVDVLPDSYKVSVPKSYPCTCEEPTLWHLHILLTQKLTPKATDWNVCVLKVSQDYLSLKIGDRCIVGGIVWRQSLPSVRLSSAHVLLPSRGLHVADKNSHSVKPFSIVIFVCLGKRQTCNVQRETREGAGALTGGIKFKEGWESEWNAKWKSNCGAIWTEEHRSMFVYATCGSQRTCHIRFQRN